MTRIRTRRSPRTHRIEVRFTKSMRARVTALALLNGVPFDVQLSNMIWGVLR